MKANLIAFLVAVAAAACCAGDTLPEGADVLGGYYELRSWQVEVAADGFKEKVRMRLTILNPRGDDLAYLSVMSSEYYLLDGAKADVFDAQGRKIYSKKEGDWGKVCGFGPSYSLYSDVCFRYFRATGPGYPYTIEWEAEWHSNSLFFWRSADFQQGVPVARAVYELKCPTDVEFQHKVYGLDISPDVRAEGNRNFYRWEAAGIPARGLQGDGFHTPEYQDYARVAFSPGSFSLDKYRCAGRDWDAIAAWYRDMAKDRYLDAKSEEEPPSDPDSLRALAREIYRSVIDNNRYVAVSIGVGGWQPHSAASTEQNAYGDCKDLTTLLVSRLRNRGLPANPALVLTRNAGFVDTTFPSGGFNHVITMLPIGGDTIWMDPTCEICPFGDIPVSDEDIFVLAVADNRGAVVRTPASKLTDNLLIRKTRIRISAELRPSFESIWTASCNSAAALEGALRHSDSEERVELLKGRLSRSARNWTVDLKRFEREEVGGHFLRVEFDGNSSRPLLGLGDGYVLTPFVFSFAMAQEDIDLSKRSLPVDLGFPRQVVDTVVVTWSRQLIPDSVIAPTDSVCSYALGSCALSMQLFQDSAVAVMVSSVKGYELPQNEFASFRSYCTARNRLAEACIRFRARKPGE